ncbi:DEAD/DEAH box helicase [Microbacterium aurantiacum]|uniref:DEAD/DEAH box helicase n=1 Tax=Microbacterium aurantiacum TaxID=162393 RepID=UPI003F49AB58
MPKNKKPAGGRPAKNFEPRYGERSQGSYQDRKRRTESSAPGRSGAPAGSRSPGHRGYRPETEDAAPKRRWSAQEKVGRDEARGIRTQGSADRAGRRPADARPERGRTDRMDRVPRDDRRTFGDARPSTRDDRPRRSFDEDRPRKSFDNDRPRKSFDNDRPRKSFDNDRPRRSFDNDRPRKSFDNDRPRRDQSTRPVRTRAQDDRVDVVHDRLQAQAVQATVVEGATFSDLGLGDNIVRVLADLGAASPFPIQAATIGPILAGTDVLARGRTGSGKTIAFGAPLVESILRSQAGKRRAFGRNPRALILAPTRELALQIDRTIQPIARSVGLFTTQIYGGVPQGRQVGALKKGVDIIIGTPGRIEDLVEQGKLDLSDIEIAVLDEADHMCELGFLEPVQRILRHTADGSQKLLFSATLDREVAALVDEFLVEPAVYEVAGEDQDSGTIDHRVLVIDHRDKADILASLVEREGKTLVFARTRAYAETLAEQFDDAGIRALALHGDLNQAKRTRNLERLTSGRVQVLVATDVAARGIHVDDIDLVVQADAPDEYKTYLHRSGRTGRAGRAGTVVTLITRQRRRRMSELLDRAEIDAPFEDARPGDDLLEELSGRQASNVDA